MKIRIKAPYAAAQSSGIFGVYGKEIEIGTELDFENEPTAWAGRYDILSGGDSDGKTAIINPEHATTGYAVKDKGASWFVITKDGEEVTKSFRKADVDGFDEMSEEDKGAFIDLHKKEA